MASRQAVVLALLLTLIPGCAGNVKYIRPGSSATLDNSKVIDKPRDTVWDSTVVALTKHSFVINNMDRSSGYINLRYAGDPRDYVDCGRYATVDTPPWHRRNTLSESRIPAQDPPPSPHDVPAANGMSLDGRINLVFEALAQYRTRVTVTILYVLSRSAITDVYRTSMQTHDAISFTSGGRTSFPPDAMGRVTECAATGSLERDVLDLIR
jgi:hypothetical protein